MPGKKRVIFEGIFENMDWEIIGHEQVKSILGKQLAAGVFPHAYLFCGPAGVGKKSLGLELAKKILQTQNLDRHPDFIFFDGQKEITVATARELIERLVLSPFMGKRKVALIDGAENLNQQSGNALLKTLEEAGDDTIIILVAGAGEVLPTIVSRCQVLRFSAFSPAQLQSFVEQRKLVVTPEILALAFGSPARLLKFIDDKDFLQQQSETVKEYTNLTGVKAGEKLAQIAKYAEADNEELAKKITTWLFWQLNKLPEDLTAYAKIRVLNESLVGLQSNFNKKLILQNLFLKLWQ